MARQEADDTVSKVSRPILALLSSIINETVGSNVAQYVNVQHC